MARKTSDRTELAMPALPMGVAGLDEKPSRWISMPATHNFDSFAYEIDAANSNT